MKYIVSGTNRPDSRSLKISQIIQGIYKELGEEVGLIDLKEVGLEQVNGSQYGENKPAALEKAVVDLTKADGIIMVVPEYNGSMPGALKYFIDHWNYPDTYEYRPICYVGLGGQFAGVRPVEHLQDVMGYRSAFSYPKRVFFANIWTILGEDGLDEKSHGRLVQQAEGFQKFVRGLQSEGLDANSVNAAKE